MEGIAILINAGILYTSFGLALYSLISLVKLTYNYFKTKDKSMVKSDLKKTAIIIAIALSLLYLIGFAGEFRKMDLSDEAAGQLLSADISQIESGDYYLEIANEQSDEEYRVYVVKYSGDTSLYDSPFYYRQIERFFDHQLTDEDSFVVVWARESDRDFKQLPIVQEHMTRVGIVQGEEVLEISYWDSENSDEILKKTLEHISEVGLENNISEQ